MPIVVQKYGGSSVADADKIRAVAARVMQTKAQGYDVVVVVSAMGDTTDDLLARAKEISPNPDRRELDMLLTTGERISMALLSIAIRELGGDAISFTGSQCGIVTNDRHFDARIIEVRPVRVQDELARGRIVVIAGYQGMSYRREVTTLGRGGSDTTAVAMAAALGAEWCEICSDVDGLASAGLTVLVSTHYMDEAERCHELAYIAYGKLLTRGTVAEVIAGAGLVTWAVTGPDLTEVAHRLRRAAGILTVAPFGAVLHVSASSTEALRAAMAALPESGLNSEPIAPSLEDVFIALMRDAKDNFARQEAGKKA